MAESPPIAALSVALPPLDATNATRLENGGVISAVRKGRTGIEVQTLIRCPPKRVFELLTN